MACRSPGFGSVFRTVSSDTKRERTTPQLQPDFNIDYSISECSSSSDRTQDSQGSPLRISGYSSDENGLHAKDGYVNKVYIKTQQNTHRNLLKTNRLKNSQSKKTKRLKKDLKSQQKFRPPKILTPRSNNITAEDSVVETPSSPWQKVRRDFTKLRYSTYRRSLNTSKISAENLCNNEGSSFNSDENYIEEASSPSSSADEERTAEVVRTPKIALNIMSECRSVSSYHAPLSTISVKTRMRCRKDGYLYLLLRTLREAKMERKFLEHDKKLGLKIGVRLTVLKVEMSFSVYMATVQLDNGSKETPLLYVIIDTELAKKVKVGSILEAYFSEKIAPYEISMKQDEEAKPTFVQPHKLLLLK